MRLKSIFGIFFLLCSFSVWSQLKPEKLISDSLTAIANQYAAVGKVNGISISTDTRLKTVTITVGDALSYIPFRTDNVERIYSMLGNVLKTKYPDYRLICITDNEKIEDLIPAFYSARNTVGSARVPSAPDKASSFLTRLSKPYQANRGLDNRIIALWQSHGLYFNQSQQKWVWQRAKLFQTVEDLYTQSYVLPFLVPMLENAGATVFLPRERDTRREEIIVDNDESTNNSRYRETSGSKDWKEIHPGFGNFNAYYIQGENPFLAGTYAAVDAVNDIEEISTAEWIPNIPETGKYAVYVSYKSLPNSAKDARYSVYYKGGENHFKINQTMGGGTWIYLGHYMFEKGKNPAFKVVLSNYSDTPGKVITADAVKIGGGMGNIARYNKQQMDDWTKQPDSLKTDITRLYSLSNYPRFTEGARYWLQWAGVPDSVYSRTGGVNDYSDDFQSRGFWVNYLAGGSSVLPKTKGLGIPVDMAFAFHSDAGSTTKDTIVGTLGICSVKNTYGKTVFANGNTRLASRDMTDIIQSQITSDLRAVYTKDWTRRGLWDKSYSESRVPEVPTMLLELLSHQNFADMRYGLDPRFKFTVSRAIYKGILRFLNGSDENIVVQPLPVDHFHCQFVGRNRIRLNWKPVNDPLEPTARATKYIVYTRIGDEGFNSGRIVTSPWFEMDLQFGKIYSFKITAVNDGGESFPSEILSACKMNNNKREVLVINGFDRVSGPVSFTTNGNLAGFDNDADPGVPYLSDYSFVGKQHEFNRSKTWKSDDDAGFGFSYNNFEDKVIAGNTFDYPYLHGKSIKSAGYSFVSSTLKPVLAGEVKLSAYQFVDLILGNQKSCLIGDGKSGTEFETMPLSLQNHIRSYLGNGGNLLISGAYIGSGLKEGNIMPVSNKLFIENTLHYSFKTANASFSKSLLVVPSPYGQFARIDFDIFNTPNEKSYYAGSVDDIEPAGIGAFTICRYKGTNNSAAVAYSGKYRCCSMGFPFEIITDEKDRNRLMASVLEFFDVKKTTFQMTK